MKFNNYHKKLIHFDKYKLEAYYKHKYNICNNVNKLNHLKRGLPYISLRLRTLYIDK